MVTVFTWELIVYNEAAKRSHKSEGCTSCILKKWHSGCWAHFILIEEAVAWPTAWPCYWQARQVTGPPSLSAESPKAKLTRGPPSTRRFILDLG